MTHRDEMPARAGFREDAVSKRAKELVTPDVAFGKKVPTLVKLVLAGSLAAVVLASFALGRFAVAPADLLGGVYNHFFNPELVGSDLAARKIDSVIFEIRVPRILLVILVGAGLAVAGASYQGMFKNPLVSPDLLGASAGASLGACLGLLFDQPVWAVQLCAFFGGIVAVSAAVGLTRAVRYDPILGLVLGGILVSTLFQSGMSLVKLVADASDKLPLITFWLMGSFASVNNDDLLWSLVPFVVGFALLLLQRWQLNVLSFGDEEARALGVNTRRVRLLVITASTLLTSVSVAVAGIVGWIGLVIPHLARAVVGPNYRVLLPTSLFVGASYLLVVDNIARLATAVEIPIGILTALLGVPFFVFIFRQNMRGWR
ncbi:MAG: iron ABC transporter permease [Coriobacteriales bacterium]|jgi:iron complex transport system permease protein|nr:iron ABC transporter permease [Coriobacteriales bacterium]